MRLKVAFIGFGNVAREFARMLEERRAQLEAEYGLSWQTGAIATGSHGCITSNHDIDLEAAGRIVERGGQLSEIEGSSLHSTSFEVIERCSADVLFETSPMSPADGQPAIDYIRAALARRIHVITANKGPVAFAYRELKQLAARFGVTFRFEGSVMDGTPVFNLAQLCLPATRVLAFEGVLNSTSNLILTLMESGATFDEALLKAQRLGVAEADPDNDIDGWDAMLKARALANVLMGAEGLDVEVSRTGIRGIAPEQLAAAKRAGFAIRLIARASAEPGRVIIGVAPERAELDSLLASVTDTSNALLLHTDLMGEIAILETDPGLRQTAYALLSDLLLLANA